MLVLDPQVFSQHAGNLSHWLAARRQHAGSLSGHALVSTRAIWKDMLFILHTVPVAFSADSKLIRNSVLFTPETLDIQAVTRESSTRKSAWKMVRDVLSYATVYKGRVGLVVRFWSSHQSVWLPMGTQNWVWYVLMTLQQSLCWKCVHHVDESGPSL